MCESGPDKIHALIKTFESMFFVRDISGGDDWSEWITKKAEYTTPFTWKDILDKAEGCPACTLATMRALGLCHYWHDAVHREFDFKKLMEEWWKDRNADKWEDVAR